jgi:hypothetical protein
MNTRDCVNFLIRWTDENLESIPKGDYSFLGESRIKELERGHTRVSYWSRRGIKKSGNITYRVFENSQNLFDNGTMFLVIEEDAILQVQRGTRDDFKKYFNRIGYNWGGWS